MERNSQKKITGKKPSVSLTSIDSLVFIDMLEVGPAHVTPNRLSAPYRIHRNGKMTTAELIFKYEEPVFDPSDAGSINLASMMAAQVALNYGLFCKTIHFHGLYEDADRQFVRDMMENTSREIWVKKFLEPNPFLSLELSNVSDVHPTKFTRAQIEFSSPLLKHKQVSWQPWDTRRDWHAILSSGGKDSLLSFGLMNEISHQVHPIFVNESGRHWFTALNAYRHFKENIPHTARVWTNADRLFTFFLRHFPFIRQDFASVRSDEYPIRLWTVAVFLFGALPLLRKRGIGRLLIGDEYDTTARGSFKGITHYNGLYDQSRYFDNTLSRYFLKKGWFISQFSILRPLSEMLIEKVLVNRYPHLQAHQMSCHATHIEDGRVKPCGRCEKCRRIVGMLLALNADPQHCGYTAGQIRYCLQQLVEKGVHQEISGANHLLYLLHFRGKIQLPDTTAARLKPAPEIMKLRFDPERSPVDGIPTDLRIPLYRILLTYADGAVKRQNRKWTDFDVMQDPALQNPFPFEIGGMAGATHAVSNSASVAPDQEEYLWGHLSWKEAEKRLLQTDVAILPVGAIEQHGPHLPLDTDAFDAEYLAHQVAAACAPPKPLVLPLIAYGVSYHHDAFKGTISISNETLSRFVYEIGMSVAKNGIKKLLIINGHGGNDPSLNLAAQMINRDAYIFVAVDTGQTSDKDISQIAETPNDVHAGEIETSTTLAIRPQLVKMELAKPMIPEFSIHYLNFTASRGVPWYVYTDKISETGVMGDPTRASKEKGAKIWQIMIAHLVALVEELKRLTLEEIFQKRY